MMTREEQLKVWEAETQALLERVSEGRSVVGRSERMRLLLMTLETSVDWLRIEQGLPLRYPVVKWTADAVTLPKANTLAAPQAGEVDHLEEPLLVPYEPLSEAEVVEIIQHPDTSIVNTEPLIYERE